MHRTIGYLSKRFVQVRPGEGRKVLLTFGYFFLIITAYYVIKPVSRSLVLGELGSRFVPYIDLVCAILMGPLVTLFARLVDRMSKPRLVSWSFWGVVGILLIFWKLLERPMPWLAGLFYLWVAIFSVLVVTLFWLVANDLYRPRDAKRLFGFIGSGGILGGIVGSSLAAIGAHLWGTTHLLVLSAGLLIGCWLLVQELWRLSPEVVGRDVHAAAASGKDTFLSNVGDFTKLLLRSRYLLLLIALVGLNKIIATLIYYQLNPFIERAFPLQDARTAFTSMFFGGMNVAAFIVQFFFTSWILRRMGLSVALLVLPVGILAGATGLFLVPVFWLAAVTELYDGSLNYSLQQTSKEVLYLPIDRSIRYKVKPFIDMVVFRFGKGLAAVCGIVLLDAMGVPAHWLSVIVVPLALVWIWVAIQLRRDYVVTIRTMLQARAAARRAAHKPPSVSAGDPSPATESRDGSTEPGSFGALTDGQRSVRKLALVDRFVTMRSVPANHVELLLTQLREYDLSLAEPFEVEGDLHHLRTIVWDQRESLAKRRRAIRLLARVPQQPTVEYLLGMLAVEADVALRQEAAMALVAIRLEGAAVEFPARAIRQHIAREVETYQRILDVAAIYRTQHRGALSPDDPLLELLRALLEESVQQVFRLLMLVYRPEDMHLVYEQMRAADPHLRADALELLDNLVDRGMRTTIFPLLDEDRFLGTLEEASAVPHEPTDAFRVLQEAIWDHHCWLSVATLCAVGRLQLTTMRQELEKAAGHPAPLVSTAAKLALHLSTLS